VTAKAIGFWTALDRRNRLRDGVVCSEPWLETVVRPSADGQTWLYLPEVYPPGGGKTLMRNCPACGRICPPSGADGSPCCDCRTEKEQRGFLKWALQRRQRELLPDLRRRWWRSAISYADFVERPTAGLLGGLCLGQPGEDTAEEEEGNAFCADAEGPSTSDEKGQTGSISDPVASREIALRRLGWNPSRRTRRTDWRTVKREKGRCPGCQFLLLPEGKGKLQEEIAYYREHGRIRPSARRYSRHNPYLPALEDYDSPIAYSEDTDPDAVAIDVEAVLDW